MEHMKRTGPVVARQLKKHGQLLVQTLAMRRVQSAAWQMIRSPDDAKCRRFWEESTAWRCADEREAYVKLMKDDPRNNTKWKRPLPGHATYWERPFTRLLGDAWIPKIEGLWLLGRVALLDKGAGTNLACDAEFVTT